MALQIIGAGFGRTGTLSVCTALNQLGFPCYHMVEVMRNPANKTHLDFWLKVARAPEGMQHDWETVFSQYTAAVDNPACCVWRELTTAYPDAKVLLTLHPKGADAWYDSTVETIYFSETSWQFGVLKVFTPFGRKFGEMCTKLMWGRSHRGTMNNRAAAVARYNQLIDEVKAAIPPERLLIYSSDQGWDPLCKFLGVPVPAGDFPRVNDRAAVKKDIATMTRAAYGILAGVALVAVALMYGAYRVAS